MGYGGHLIWTAVFRAMQAQDPRPILLAGAPQLSDVLSGHWHNRAVSFADSEVFRGNPRVRFTQAARKSPLARAIDAVGFRLLAPRQARQWYDGMVFRWSRWASRRLPYQVAHVDMQLHSYMARLEDRRMMWKSGGHAAEVIARTFGCRPAQLEGELWLDPEDTARADALLAQRGVADYLVIEPSSSAEWFGRLRTWPCDRWQTVVEAVRARWPELAVVQVGVAEGPRLSGVVDLCGATSFREAARIIQRSRLFLGGDGGLMHAAAAVGAPSVIVWGGVNLPEFLGYPRRHRVVCAYVACAPCGQLGWCDVGHRCMTEIGPERVIAAVEACLQAPRASRDPVSLEGRAG